MTRLQITVGVGVVAAFSLVAYACGYFAFSDSTTGPAYTVRTFRSTSIAFAYLPLGWFESKIRRRTICVGMPGRSELGGRMICFEP